MAAEKSGNREPREAPPSGAESVDPAREAWGLLLTLLRSLRGQLHALHTELELTPAQGQVLHLLEPGVAQPMSGLAGGLACDPSNVTGLVDRLEARGLVERRSTEHDRRVKMLALTPEGERLRAALLERLREPPELLRHLPVAEQCALRDILRRALTGAGLLQD